MASFIIGNDISGFLHVGYSKGCICFRISNVKLSGVQEKELGCIAVLQQCLHKSCSIDQVGIVSISGRPRYLWITFVRTQAAVNKAICRNASVFNLELHVAKKYFWGILELPATSFLELRFHWQVMSKAL